MIKFIEEMKIITSKFFSKYLSKFISEADAFRNRYKIQNIDDGMYFVTPVPEYQSQFSNYDKKLVVKVHGLINDHHAAKAYGTLNIEDYSYWSWRSCGIACIHMVCSSILGNNFKKTMYDLVSDGLSYHGYNITTDVGWYHKALVQIAKKYNVNAHAERFVPINKIAVKITNREFVIASLKSNFGGHLVLIYGVDIKNGRIKNFITHDPNNFSVKGNARIYSYSKFRQLFNHRIIVCKSY